MMKEEKVETDSFPSVAYLYPTMLCNLHCKMCYSGSHQDTEMAENELSLEEYKNLISILYKKGIRKFDISGGEPLLRHDIVQIIEEIKSYRGTLTYMVTNGTLIHKNVKKLQFILSKIDRIYISFDSTEEHEHNAIRGDENAYKNSLEGLSQLQKLGFKNIGINFLIMSDNQKSVQNILQFAQEYEIRYINLLRLLDVSEKGTLYDQNLALDCFTSTYLLVQKWMDKKNLEESSKELDITFVMPGYCMESLLPYRKRNSAAQKIKLLVEFDPMKGCLGFQNSMIISSKGDVTGCTAMINMQEFDCGNIRENSIETIYNNFQLMSRNLKIREEKLHKTEPCKSCKSWRLCKGGCPAVTYKYYNTIMKNDPTCIMMKK